MKAIVIFIAAACATLSLLAWSVKDFQSIVVFAIGGVFFMLIAILMQLEKKQYHG